MTVQQEARPDHWIASAHPLVDFVSTAEAAALLGVSQQHVLRQIESGVLLPTFQIGGTGPGSRRYCNRQAVLELLKQRKAAGLKTPTQYGRRGPLPKPKEA